MAAIQEDVLSGEEQAREEEAMEHIERGDEPSDDDEYASDQDVG